MHSPLVPVPVLTSTIHGHLDKLELTLGYSSRVPDFVPVYIVKFYNALQVFTYSNKPHKTNGLKVLFISLQM